MKYQMRLIEGVDYADLKLRYEPEGSDIVSFDADVLIAFCRANNLPADAWLNEDNIATVMAKWYRLHRAAGGAPDPVREQIAFEVELEDRLGGGFSHEGGRA